MTGQLDLMDAPQARRTDPSTSRAADLSNKCYRRQSQAGRVLLAVGALGEANADEVDVYLGWRVTTAGRRIHELVKADYLEYTKTEHLTSGGLKGHCVRLTPKGRAWINEGE